jgi:predicted nucleic acid-binding protein
LTTLNLRKWPPFNAQECGALHYALLSTYPHLEWIAATLDVADSAARLRAQYNLKTPDAIQAATALTSKATGLISNDPAFARVAELETIILDALLPAKEGETS